MEGLEPSGCEEFDRARNEIAPTEVFATFEVDRFSPEVGDALGDRRARELIERAVAHLSDDDAVLAVLEVWTIAPALVDSAVVAAATTPNRSLAIAASLFERGAGREAYAVLVHGLSLEAAEDLTTDEVMKLLSVPVLEGLAAEAEEQGDEEVAGILEAVAVAAGER